jgi:hypothetical protein
VTYLPLRNNRLLATLFLAALIISFAGRMTAIMGAYLGISFCVLLANVPLFASASQRERNAITALIVVVSVMLPISLLKSETALIHFVVTLISVGAAFVLTRNVRVYLWASRMTLVLAQVYVFVYLARRGIENFPLQDMIPDSSSNGVTSYMVLLQANYCVVNYAVNRRVSLLTAIATLTICVVGFGRGSILSAAAIVGLGFVSKVWLGSRGQAAFAAALLLIVGVVTTVRYGDEIATFVSANTKIGSGLFDVHRAGMMAEYLEGMDPVTVWTGGSYAGTSIVSEYNGNPHNSFIRAHYIFGLPYLALILLIPAYLFHPRHARSVMFYCGCLWMIVLFRAFTEPVLFPTLFDFFYFAPCFVLNQDPHPHAAASTNE